MIEEDTREEQYELDETLNELQRTFEHLKHVHLKFTRVFRNEMEAMISDTAALMPDVAPDVVEYKDLEISLLSGRCFWKKEMVPLSTTEMKMVVCLATRPDIIYTRAYFLDAFCTDADSDRIIDSHIKRIRRKFEAVDEKFSKIYTVYGAGYRWNL